jgi:cellulose synthase/poly-beta-1,6-N-acetylglucosamine synthase-like glycosyltransferase
MSSVLIAGYGTITVVFLAYTFRPYFFSSVRFFKRDSKPASPSAHSPMVTVVLPAYNEANVIERVLQRCTTFDYDNYEVIVVDDSNDGTTEKLAKWASRVKVVHRNSRKGWKGGAINESLKFFNKNSEYTIVLDADSLPEKDLIRKFISKIEDGYDVVQGVQVPDLNISYNRIAEAAAAIQGYYQFIEQPSKGMVGLPVSITGSNFIIKTELLKKFKFAEDIGEDWDLTLRLLSSGHRIKYDPEVVTRCESPYTVGEAIKQYIRWSEGMVRATVKHLNKIMKSDMKFISKMDIIMTGFSPLITLLLIASTVMGAYLAINNASFQLVLIPVSVFTLLSGFVTMVASTLKMGINPLIAFLSEALYFIFVPFSIYASLRGFALKKGHFHRTTKLGYISS